MSILKHAVCILYNIIFTNNILYGTISLLFMKRSLAVGLKAMGETKHVHECAGIER